MPVTVIGAPRSTSLTPTLEWAAAPITQRQEASGFDRLITSFELTAAYATVIQAARIDASAGADLYALRPEALGPLARRVRALRRHVTQEGRAVQFVLPFRPVLAKAEEGFLARIGGRSRKAQVRIGEDAIDLTGTLEQIAEALLDYDGIGIDHMAIHGFDLRGASSLDAELDRLVRRKIAHRDALLNILAG